MNPETVVMLGLQARFFNVQFKWIGDIEDADLSSKAGSLLLHSRIQSLMNGCMLHDPGDHSCWYLTALLVWQTEQGADYDDSGR
jgi:hypothetical protein